MVSPHNGSLTKVLFYEQKLKQKQPKNNNLYGNEEIIACNYALGCIFILREG